MRRLECSSITDAEQRGVNAVADRLINARGELEVTGRWIKSSSIQKDKILVAVDGNGEMFLNLLE